MGERAGTIRKAAFLGAFLLVSGLLFCGLSLAAGAHGGADRTGDLLDLLYRFINFALLVIILFVVLKKAGIKGILATRSEEIGKRLEALKSGKEEAERKYRDLEKRIQEFEKNRQDIIDQFRAEGLAEKERLIGEARERVKQILDQADVTIQREMESAKDRLKRELIGLAAQKAEEILDQEMTDDDQERLVDEFIERLGKVH
ncbi:MAG: ATP synthase F0 subunit B [Deltaproteobacteria bacterium]|nr:ATP synthase F0 subunit B [Deltaproteobacteria bacterium]